jgi:hypothetical protein
MFVDDRIIMGYWIHDLEYILWFNITLQKDFIKKREGMFGLFWVNIGDSIINIWNLLIFKIVKIKEMGIYKVVLLFIYREM